MREMRDPPFTVERFGCEFIVSCSVCGQLEQTHSAGDGRRIGRSHQRWEHPTDDEREQDQLRQFEEYHMDGTCPRCGHDGHAGADCPTVTPDLLKSWGS